MEREKVYIDVEFTLLRRLGGSKKYLGFKFGLEKSQS